MFGHRFVRQLRASAYVHWRRGWRAGGPAGAAGSGAPRAPHPSQLQHARGVAAAAGAAGALLTQLVQRAGLKLAGGAMVLGGGFTVLTKEQQVELEATSETAKLPWVQALAAQPGMREVLVPGQQLRKHPVGQLVSEEDHLVGWRGLWKGLAGATGGGRGTRQQQVRRAESELWTAPVRRRARVCQRWSRAARQAAAGASPLLPRAPMSPGPPRSLRRCGAASRSGSECAAPRGVPASRTTQWLQEKMAAAADRSSAQRSRPALATLSHPPPPTYPPHPHPAGSAASSTPPTAPSTPWSCSARRSAATRPRCTAA
jgi:hypothetical protein